MLPGSVVQAHPETLFCPLIADHSSDNRVGSSRTHGRYGIITGVYGSSRLAASVRSSGSAAVWCRV